MKIFRFLISSFFSCLMKVRNRNAFITGRCFLYKVSLQKSGINTILLNHCSIIRTSIRMEGNGNVLKHEGVLRNSTVHMFGNNNELIFNKDISFLNLKLVIRGNNCKIIVGRETTFGGGYLICMGEGNEIIIGNDCQIADDVSIWATDSHPIVDMHGGVYNTSKPIYIEDHVWIGNKSIVLKGVTIGKDSVIGMGSVVTKNIDRNSLCVGNPAKKIKDILTWNRSFITK